MTRDMPHLTLFADPDVALYCGDASDVCPWLPASSVDCVVTSPPYADARDDVPALDLDEFPRWLGFVLYQLRDVVKPTGSVLLNLGRRFRDGVESDYMERTLDVARQYGWSRIDTIVWRKTNANGRGGPYLHDQHEIVYWLATRPLEAYRGYDEHTRRPYSEETLSRYGRTYRSTTKLNAHHDYKREAHPLGARPASVFECSVGKEKGNPHPTPMPLELARHLVALGCPPGGVVLDPFAGSGNTLLAARQLHRNAIGVELSEQWARVCADRLSQQSLFAFADASEPGPTLALPLDQEASP